MPVKRRRHIKKSKIKRRYLVAVALVMVLFGYVGLLFPKLSLALRGSPKRANYFLGWNIPASKVTELAQWDLLILDMETQVNSADAIRRIRSLNPGIIILAYITPEEIKKDAGSSSSIMRRKLASGINESWYLTNIQNNKLTFWPGTWMLDVADNAPAVNGFRFNQYLAQFVSQEILSTGLWNGVFYDNAWKDVKWLTGDTVDLNKDGLLDTEIDYHWQQGMREIYQETRRLAGNKYILVGNATSDAYKNDLNGVMLESFPSFLGWKQAMKTYASNQNGQEQPRFMIINVNTGNNGKNTNYKKVRFGLASTLLLDGYYSFDFGDQDHGQTWWYDEYSVDLGNALGSAISLNNKPQFEEDVWRREYQNGIALVNATDQAQDVELGGDYEKIKGAQDKVTNDGAIVSQVNLQSKDGLVMLRPVQSLKNIVFKNGNFVRFFNANGTRSRNGLFIYEEGILGGSKIYYGDLDGDGLEEKIVATGQKLQIFNSAGEIWFDGSPFDASYKGELNIAIGRLANDPADSIVVSQNKGGEAIVYNYHGEIVKEKIFPLGRKFKSGLSVALAESNSLGVAKNGQVIVGTAGNSRPEVIIFDNNLSKISRRFFVDTKILRGELGVAVGDVNGDKNKEIIVALDYGTSKQVKVYNFAGKLLSQFKLSGSFTTGALKVGAVDVDFDGRDEIVLMNGQ
jgi:hypothetical protein